MVRFCMLPHIGQISRERGFEPQTAVGSGAGRKAPPRHFVYEMASPGPICSESTNWSHSCIVMLSLTENPAARASA